MCVKSKMISAPKLLHFFSYCHTMHQCYAFWIEFCTRVAVESPFVMNMKSIQFGVSFFFLDRSKMTCAMHGISAPNSFSWISIITALHIIWMPGVNGTLLYVRTISLCFFLVFSGNKQLRQNLSENFEFYWIISKCMNLTQTEQINSKFQRKCYFYSA